MIEDEEPMGECYYCNALLEPWFDWFCITCERQACDNCSQACQVDVSDCNTITCINCVDAHLQTAHPGYI